MGRPAKGLQVKPRGGGWLYAYFTWDGHAHRIALGTRDQREAEKAAAREYASVVSGVRKPRERRTGRSLDLADLLSSWIESKRTSVVPKFLVTLEGYARQYVDYFGSLDKITKATGTNFGLDRLGVALRKTVLRELAYLRQFLEWCELHKFISHIPVIPRLPPKAKGKRTGTQPAKAVVVTPKEVAMILAKLPDESKTIDGRKWPIRDRYALAWELALRPGTIARLSVPEHWQPGWGYIEIADEIDKARYGRTLDLTPKAAAILRRVAPERGLVFGDHNFTKALKTAATAVLGPVRGSAFFHYAIRHARAKDLLDGRPEALRGVSYVLGHLRPTTTNIYVAPDRQAGARALGVKGQLTHKRKPKQKKGARGAGKTG